MPRCKKLSPPQRVVENVGLDALRLYANNAKTHSRKQITAIARSIATYGFTNPVLVDERNEIVAGHGRLEAARLAGLTTVPVIRLTGLTQAQKRAYRIADNRLAEVGTDWSFDKLQLEFAGIAEDDINFDLSMTGFELDEIERLDDRLRADEDVPEPPLPAPPERATTRLGDVWRLGEHRLVCGDASSRAPYGQLLGRGKSDLVITDPPYNVPIVGNVSGLGRHRHAEFVQASGEMSTDEFQRFLLAFMLEAARAARPGALHYIFMDWRGLLPLQLAAAAAYDEQINLCVWAKTNGGMGSLYRSQHELVAIYKKGKAGHTNNVRLGAVGRHRTNLWSYAGMNAPTAERDAALAMHPTVKPVAMIRDAILDVTNRGDIVLDPFGGSGTTLIAAAKAGRVARLIELDPRYCDVIVARAEQSLGVTAVLEVDGHTFETTAACRAEETANG